VATVVTVRTSGEAIVLFALEREAAPFRRVARGLAAIHVHVTGVGRNHTRAALGKILSQSNSPSVIITAGFCGALQPDLKVGDVVVASEVVDQSGHSWPATGTLNQSEQLKHRLLTVDHLIAKAAEKKRLGECYQADVVDMESAAVAEMCAARGMPFLAVRAVSDTVDTELSPELLRLLSGGHVSAWRAVRALLKKPTLAGEFRRLARDTRLAAQKLAETLAAIVTSSR
jgi:adenosylhomocysteine nucleosidase